MSVRRVRRVIRKIDPWTVLKVSVIFYAVVGVAVVLGVVIAWSLLQNAGVPDRLTDFITSIGGPEIVFDGERYFRVAVFLGVVTAIVLTGFTTLAAVFYNLISDVVGGIEVVVLEESVVVPQPALNGPVRPPLHTPAPSSQETPAAGLPANGPVPDPELAELPTQESTTVSG